jgi:hypothetical protein
MERFFVWLGATSHDTPLLPADTYERVLTRTLMDIENRVMLEAQERWEAVQLETNHRIESRKLLTAPKPAATEQPDKAQIAAI